LPYDFVISDFNGDGIPDVATANPVSDDVSVLLGRGDGTFEAPLRFAAGFTSNHLAVGDFNGDGVLLAVSNDDSNDVSILLGRGDGTFQDQVRIPMPPYGAPYGIVTGDFNGDGHTDLAVNERSGSVDVLLGNGDGTFQSPVDYAVG